MKQCKPCMTIRMFFKLLIKNYRQFREDLKEYSKINYYACELPKHKPMKLPEDYTVEKIRKLAAENYNPNIKIVEDIPSKK